MTHYELSQIVCGILLGIGGIASLAWLLFEFLHHLHDADM